MVNGIILGTSGEGISKFIEGLGEGVLVQEVFDPFPYRNLTELHPSLILKAFNLPPPSLPKKDRLYST